MSGDHQTPQHVGPTNPGQEQKKDSPTPNGATSLVSPKPNTPPFSAYLQIVSFIATITISVSISASQGFATGGNFFGVALNIDNSDPATAELIRGTRAAANWLSWSAAASSCSLIITLVLQLLLTDESFVRAVMEERALWRSIPGSMISYGSWIALGLQGSALGLMGQALKVINKRSGAMIQVNMHVKEWLT
jgi:hypothetical protein